MQPCKSCPEPLLQRLQARGSDDPISGPNVAPETNVKQVINLKLGSRSANEQKIIITLAAEGRRSRWNPGRWPQWRGGGTGGSVNKDEEERSFKLNQQTWRVKQQRRCCSLQLGWTFKHRCSELHLKAQACLSPPVMLRSVFYQTLLIKGVETSSFIGWLCCFLSSPCRGQRFAGMQTCLIYTCAACLSGFVHELLRPVLGSGGLSFTPPLFRRLFHFKSGEAWKRIYQRDGRRSERGLFLPLSSSEWRTRRQRTTRSRSFWCLKLHVHRCFSEEWQILNAADRENEDT